MTDRSDDVFVLIIAGGRGTRFWPWSRRGLPKQCLSVNGETTLIRATVDRVLPIIPAERVLVVTSAEMAEPLRAELGMLPPENLLVEPEGRNTAPAVGWGVLEVGHRSHGRNAVMIVLPSDHLIREEDELRDLLLDCAEAARATNALVTIGLVPTRAETGYGYLEVGGALGSFGDRPFLRVSRFVEKPDAELAAQYVAGGEHLWNAGMFVFTVEAMRDAYRQHLPRTWTALEQLRAHPERLVELYNKMDRTSIDYGVMERHSHVLTVRGELGWSDVGSWEALAEILPPVSGGVGRAALVVSHDAQQNVVYAPGQTVALLGVEGLVVVQVGDVLMVCPRERAQDVRALTVALEQLGETRLL